MRDVRPDRDGEAVTLPSEQSAARFLALRDRRRRRGVRRERAIVQRMREGRIAVDFAPATLKAIHDALVWAVNGAWSAGDTSTFHSLLVGEQMIAVALGIPPANDPPLTGRRRPRKGDGRR